MKIMTEKNTRKFAWFLIISGFGAAWLTFWWGTAILLSSNPSSISTTKNDFSSWNVLYYYSFNSALLIFSGLILYARRFKIFSILAILLGVSVTTSLFIFEKMDGSFLLNNLFIQTVYLGMLLGIIYGGTILVPMFLMSVYLGLYRGIQYFRGKVVYSNSQGIIENQIKVAPENNSENNPPLVPVIEKGMISIIICYLGIFISIFYIITGGLNSFSSSRGMLMTFLAMVVLGLSIFSLKSKNKIVYMTINIIILIMVLYPLFFLAPSLVFLKFFADSF